jgi:hypothetical protein
LPLEFDEEQEKRDDEDLGRQFSETTTRAVILGGLGKRKLCRESPQLQLDLQCRINPAARAAGCCCCCQALQKTDAAILTVLGQPEEAAAAAAIIGSINILLELLMEHIPCNHNKKRIAAKNPTQSYKTQTKISLSYKTLKKISSSCCCCCCCCSLSLSLSLSLSHTHTHTHNKVPKEGG